MHQIRGVGSDASGKRSFLVASHGCSASFWLAHTLNRLPGFACVHSSAALEADDARAYEARDAIERGELADVYRMLQLIRAGYEARHQRSPQQLFESLSQRFADRQAIGVVHSYRLRDLPGHAHPPRADVAPIPVANLLRHPVEVVNSVYGQYLLSFRIDLTDLHWTLGKVVASDLQQFERLAIEHHVCIGDFEPLCFLCACQALRGLRQDFDAIPALADSGAFCFLGNMRKEDLTTQPDLLRQWIGRLAGDDLPISDAALQPAYDGTLLNIHNPQARNSGAQAVHDGWTPWQRDVFALLLDTLQLRTRYESEGYDLSMITTTTIA